MIQKSDQNLFYAKKLAKMIQVETVSSKDSKQPDKFSAFQNLLKKLFPQLFSICDIETFHSSLLLHWKGNGNGAPILFMCHQDVVEASGNWTHAPFSGEIENGRVWGRGTLDTKGGLFSMLQAAEELAEADFIPDRDIWFESSHDEETNGSGADEITRTLKERGISFAWVLDEGGMIMENPIGMAPGTFAMIGVGEKGCLDLKFTARSAGGHASTPPKNTPLVRLGKFMAEVDKGDLFPSQLSPTIAEMFRRMAPFMKQPLRWIFRHPKLNSQLITFAVPRVSNTAAALFHTTAAFTMAQGSNGHNVLPAEASVCCNVRVAHHQSVEEVVAALTKAAKKNDIQCEVLSPCFESNVSDFNGIGFKAVEKALSEVFPEVIPAPYLMTGASDCRYFSRVSDQCIRFIPFMIDSQQLSSIHGENENVSLSCLDSAVKFYKILMKESI